jgi:hypothetical protein
MSSRQIIYEFARATTLEGWWAWSLVIGSIIGLLVLCVRFYRRDVAELSQPVRWALITLRLLTILALVFFFMNLQRRTQRMVTRSSEVAVLVDASQSMSLPADAQDGTQSRSTRAVSLLAETDLLDRLAAEHQVSIYAFGESSEPRLIDTRGGRSNDDSDPKTNSDPNARTATGSAAVPGFSLLATVGALLIGIGALLGIVALIIAAAGNRAIVGWWIMGCIATLIPGIVCLGSVYSVRTEQSLAQLLGLRAASVDSDSIPPEPIATAEDSRRELDWDDEIAASDSESRIGDAIRSILSKHDPATLAGMVLATDGQSNGGIDVGTAVAAARRAEVALYPLGLGSRDAPVNVRIVDLEVPRRVYPGDKFVVSAVLQGSGPAPLDVEVQLLDGLDQSASDSPSRAADGRITPPGDVIDSQRVQVTNEGTLTGIRFEIEPESVGRRRLAVRIVAPPQDNNQIDDVRDARYEVVSRKLKVLAVAGGPTREYRFVRNLLYRDKSIELHAWLQTGAAGSSQDADQLLNEFPGTAEELFSYDAIIMFDPNWDAIDSQSLDLLDRWLSQQAGGMVLIGGPIYHPQWTRKRTDPRVAKIAGFFPINISTRSPLGAVGRQGGENAWPLKFTPEARRAEFLWIAETGPASFDIWDAFGGVYDFVDAKSAKAGAKVYAYFSDPTTEISGSLPIYLASHFYGAGRVYFQGSGEMWRLRSESDAYFDSYYTKLIRWVGEGRLLRDSNRGLLLVDVARAQVGDTITVRAVLTDEQFEPLQVPEVPAKLLTPSGRIDDLRLLPQQGEPRAGTYGARFVVREAGSYDVRLTLGDALNEQVLQQSVQVRLPTVELERPRRNDEVLAGAAEMTGGEYLAIEPTVTNPSIVAQVTSWLQPQPQTTVLPGTPDADFTRRRNGALMWLIATMLTMEWVIRRLHRLA